MVSAVSRVTKKQAGTKRRKLSTESEFVTKGEVVAVVGDNSGKLGALKSLLGKDGASQEKTVRITADIPESLHRRLKVAGANTGTNNTIIVKALLDKNLPL